MNLIHTGLSVIPPDSVVGITLTGKRNTSEELHGEKFIREIGRHFLKFKHRNCFSIVLEMSEIGKFFISG